MVEQIVGWSVGILMVLNILYITYYNIVCISSKLKCRKKKYLKPINTCHENDCKFAKYCEQYEHVYTAEEIESIKKLIYEKKN